MTRDCFAFASHELFQASFKLPAGGDMPEHKPALSARQQKRGGTVCERGFNRSDPLPVSMVNRANIKLNLNPAVEGM